MNANVNVNTNTNTNENRIRKSPDIKILFGHLSTGGNEKRL